MSTGEDLYSRTIIDTRLKPLPPSLKHLINALLFVGLLSRSRAMRVFLFITIFILSLYMWCYTSAGKPISDLEMGCSIFVTLLRASDAFVINDLSELRLVGQRKDTDELGIWERIKWALKWMISPRQIGWTHEPRHVFPPHPAESRSKFLCSRFFNCLGYFIIADLLNTYLICYSMLKGRDVSIFDGGFFMRLFHTGLMALLVWSFFNLAYNVFAIAAVTTNLTDQSEWPEMFGKWSDAYTVRRFWGRTWHQNLRRVLTTHADFVTYRLLHLNKDTFSGTNVHRYIAFAISGLFHAVGDYGMLRSDFWEQSASMQFFLLQATIIMIEQEIGKLIRVKPGPWTRRLGYVWTLCWFGLTVPPWMGPQIKHGFVYRHVFWENRIGEVGSVTNYFWKGRWKIGEI